VLLVSACNLKEEVERNLEDRASAVVSGALDDVGGLSVSLEIPEGYPLDDFPVYGGSDSDVLGGSRQTLGDMPSYNLVVGTNDAPDAVGERIREAYESRSDDFEVVPGGGMFMGTIGQWKYCIVVSDGTADNFGALVTYALERL
jgi:hypothetical protein